MVSLMVLGQLEIIRKEENSLKKPMKELKVFSRIQRVSVLRLPLDLLSLLLIMQQIMLLVAITLIRLVWRIPPQLPLLPPRTTTTTIICLVHNHLVLLVRIDMEIAHKEMSIFLIQDLDIL